MIDLNREVAEKVMGLELKQHGHASNGLWWHYKDSGELFLRGLYPVGNYDFIPCTNHNDLALVKAKVVEDGWNINIFYIQYKQQWKSIMWNSILSRTWADGSASENEAVLKAALEAYTSAATVHMPQS